MIHELLLSLSGHPSPLLRADGQLDDSLSALISPPEQALLRKLASLGAQHNEVRARAAAVGASDPSVVSKAVAAAVLETHLGRYQDKIIEVERGILRTDSKLVAAYNTVPLSTIVVEFDGWPQVFGWLRELLDHMQARDVAGGGGDAGLHRSGADVLDFLRAGLLTGYPDLEAVCMDLLKVAEAAWLRQLSSWLLYGRIPTHGTDDFFVKASQGSFSTQDDLAPAFVTKAAATSILFVGRCVSNLNALASSESLAAEVQSRPDLKTYVRENIDLLAALERPVSAAAFTALVNTARVSLARNALRKLLPTASILHALRVLHEFLLLRRGEFALALVMTTDQHLAARRIKSNAAGSARDTQGLGGAMIKEAELSAILSKTWATLTAMQGQADDVTGDGEDEELDMARDMISMEISRSKASSTTAPENLFEDLLVGTPTMMKLAIPSPLDLFLSPEEAQVYSNANSFLLGIRRAHLHLTGLWKLSVLRRTHPGPIRPVNAATQPKLTADRERASRRNGLMRGVWAAMASTSFFLVELGEYFQGEVVSKSWAALESWIRGSAEKQASADGEAHDPETLTIAHRRYLAALGQGLLLHDPQFTRALRQLLGRVDYTVGLIQRLEVVVQTLMAGESAETSGPEHLQREEETLGTNLQETRRSLDDALSRIVKRLKEVETHQLETGIGSLTTDANDETLRLGGGRSNFSPLDSTGLSQLTMKLESARVKDGPTPIGRPG